jgi:hypothetical protein
MPRRGVRYVYIPIEKRKSRQEFTEAELDGLDRDEAWEMFKKKQSEIEQSGKLLVERFRRRPGQVERVTYQTASGDTRRITLFFGKKVLRHGDCDKPLDVIRTEQSINSVFLYVHCHGNSEVVGLRPLKLKPAELAARLRADGLPKQPTPIIKLWSCHSGERHPSEERLFVDLFTEALGKEGYDGVEVFGYEGELRVTKVGQHKTSTNQQGEASRAKRKRVGPFRSVVGD